MDVVQSLGLETVALIQPGSLLRGERPMKVMRYAVALAVTLVLVVAAHAAAQDKKAKKAKKKATVTAGIVEKVDQEGKTVTLRTGRKKDASAATVTLGFGDQTRFFILNTEGQKEAKLTDLAVGKRVKLVKETKDGKEVVTTVTIVEGKKKKQ
jgi:Cu/Ag efflux protein CusF